MRQPIYVREFSQGEREVLEAGLRSSEAFRVRRCQILLSSASGKRAREIAEELNISVKTVETQMSRAIYSLKKKLSVFLAQ